MILLEAPGNKKILGGLIGVKSHPKIFFLTFFDFYFYS